MTSIVRLRARPRAKTRGGEANVARILDAALTLFARYGLRGVTVDEVAEIAGMSKPNLLYYFRTKDALYTAVLERMLTLWLEPLIALDKDANPSDALRTYIESKLQFSRSNPEGSRLFAMEMLQGAPHLKKVLRTTLASTVAATSATIEAWIARGKLRPIAPLHLIFAMWAATQHYADFAPQIEAICGRGIQDDDFFEEARREISDLFLSGVMIRPER